MKGGGKLALCVAIAFLGSAGAYAEQQKVGAPPEASNMRLVGTDDLQARSAYQPTIHHQGDRWIAYIGHHGGTDELPDPVNPMTGKPEPNGTSIVDVTDPANPALIARIGGLKDTHKSWWECDTGIAFLVSGAPDWRTRRMTQVYDLSDPAHPVKIRDFGLPGQEPGSPGAVPTELHGPISTGSSGNRVYFGYGTNKGGFLQIVDREKLLNGPKQPIAENLRYPEISRMPLSALNGAHTAFPMPGMPIAEFSHDKDGKTRDIVMIVDEAILNECGEARQMVWFADVTTETRPMMISSYTVPEASGSFCERGGRFGSHSSSESMAPVYYKKIAFIAFFNAGVRALDIRDPYHPREVGYFIPSITPATDKRSVTIEGKDRCKIAIQTNNVETDERGYIYAVDRANTGLHILELTGEARAVAGLP
ncbi:LVIVD repeat-containing protein [Bradyrhizobium neotropicale]|uniref:LVIVD repeat-containing protein n=1 Tax=Bradyrhizobium neotropicale TaxID=1497615 RepID=UPI001AD7339B|nr:hypothetical protein [Bradyrhizobium neotropicale]MBO4227001.1 hypothetical protein [Bradyrhizobium neotropicale]